MLPIKVTIKENSLLAKIAAWKMKAPKIAIVMGSTIHLHNCTRQQFLSNKKWLNHEIVHVHQYKQLGTMRFIVHYLAESFKNGYFNNRFEVEARQKETDFSILQGISIV
jgi:hypothetical protein